MRESRLSGSVEGVMSDHDSYSDYSSFEVLAECAFGVFNGLVQTCIQHAEFKRSLFVQLIDVGGFEICREIESRSLNSRTDFMKRNTVFVAQIQHSFGFWFPFEYFKCDRVRFLISIWNRRQSKCLSKLDELCWV